ncbi:MAG: EAL domain-containing protein [Solirubrobacteraceae bacterium]
MESTTSPARTWEGAQDAIARLAAIVESSDDAIVGQTLDGTITSWNPAAERIYGYRADEALGRHMSMLCPGERERRQLAEILARVADGSRVDHFETVRRRHDGRAIDVSVTVSPIRAPDGTVVGASAVARDIGERRRAAGALAEAEERFRTAFEEAPIGMALLELDGRLSKVNVALCEISGYGAGELEAKRFDELLEPEDGGAIALELAGLSERQQPPYAREARIVHASGRDVWVAIQVTLISARDGRPVRFLAQVLDITERKHYEHKLQDLADHDALTGLLNRRSFGRALESQAARVSRYGAGGALLMLDLDHLKYVNDTLGHQAGDEVIVRAAQMLAGRLRESDVLARLGGDEFAILLPTADAAAAEQVAHQLLKAFADEPITVVGLRAREITASIGIATFESELSGEEVLVNADLAMYDAKEAGRNQVVVYRTVEHNQVRIKRRLSWVEQIQTALEERRFRLLGQPIIDYRTGAASRLELLLRMADEHGDLIPPGAFLYIAERLDMIAEIDSWVAQNAIRMLARDDGRPECLPLHINLSGRSLADPRLLEVVEAELGATGVATQLTFEITETAAVRHITHARRFGERVAALGCRLALDDFGAGFGSFYYLKHLPFDFLKIDGEFIRNCVRSRTDRLVIEAVVGIARGLGKQTIAESVTDPDTVRLLTRLGVDYGQGRYHGEPAAIGRGADQSTASAGSPAGRWSAAR